MERGNLVSIKINFFFKLFIRNLIILGFVGLPLPGVSARIVKDDIVLIEGNSNEIKTIDLTKLNKDEGLIGNLQIKGDNVFKEYWRKPESTKKEFTEDGWFKTGKIKIFNLIF